MTYNAVYYEKVKDDIRMAKEWYQGQQAGLELRFEQSVKDAISRITKMPSAYAVRYRNVRIAHTRIFPYHIHFYIVEETHQIVIIGIVHNKRQDALQLDR